MGIQVLMGVLLQKVVVAEGFLLPHFRQQTGTKKSQNTAQAKDRKKLKQLNTLECKHNSSQTEELHPSLWAPNNQNFNRSNCFVQTSVK